MSKNLIINRLNKCKAYEFNQNIKPFQDSTSKISTSTKTQQSPLPHNLNPQFTFKATDLKEILLPKPKAQQFFQNFNPTNDVIYQKAVLLKPKLLQRALEFQLLSIYRQRENENSDFMGKKLDFCQHQSPVVVKQSMQVRQSGYRFAEFVKTEYSQTYNELKYQDQYRQYFQNIPYDSKKYKLSRQKLPSNQSIKTFEPLKRCQTQSNEIYSYETIETKPFVTYQSQQNQKYEFDDYHFVNKDLRDSKRQSFNEQYIKGNLNMQTHDNNGSVEKSVQIHGIKQTKRSGNSSRLSYFRKERQHHLRKSQLEEFNNNNNNSKINKIYSYENKENIRTNSKFVPKLAFNNLSQAGQRKLKNQYSQRFLLGRRQLQQPLQSSKATLQPKGSVSYLSKQSQTRIQSIRKQLREIYQVKDKEKSRLIIMRDQQTYENNAKNSLRRVGSICQF